MASSGDESFSKADSTKVSRYTYMWRQIVSKLKQVYNVIGNTKNSKTDYQKIKQHK